MFNTVYFRLKKYTEKMFFLLLLYSLFAGKLNCQLNSFNELVILKNKNIEVGILHSLGGRVVRLNKPGFPNILKVDDEKIINYKKYVPAITPEADFVPFNGHITWVGPQKEWWSHQDVNPRLKAINSNWPPDPYLIYSENKIVEQGKDFIKLEGIHSPVSGITINKEIRIDSTGLVYVTSTMINSGKKDVGRDIWMLSRMSAYDRVYVPVEENAIAGLVHKTKAEKQATPYRIIDGFFTFDASFPKSPFTLQEQEVHLNPSQNYFVAFTDNQMFVIRLKKLSKDKIHPAQGQVELYSNITTDYSFCLLELEIHSEYKILKPGEQISLTEIWQVFEYNGKKDPEEHLKFIKEKIKN